MEEPLSPFSRTALEGVSIKIGDTPHRGGPAGVYAETLFLYPVLYAFASIISRESKEFSRFSDKVLTRRGRF